MNDINYAPVCGIFCGDCIYLGKKCAGCGYVKGKPFWTAVLKMDVCPLHDCCRNQKQLEHCGLCAEFPCKTFLELRDPNMSDDEFAASLSLRQNELQKRAEIGTDTWMQEKDAGRHTRDED